MIDLFVIRESKYNLRNFQALESSQNRTVKFCTETISCRGTQIWNLILERLRALAILYKFEKECKNGNVMRAHAECAKCLFLSDTIFQILGVKGTLTEI